MSDYSNTPIRLPSDRDRDGRSSIAANSEKFKKVMAKEQRDENPFQEKEIEKKKKDKTEESSSGRTIASSSGAKKKQKPSLFDLSATSGNSTEDVSTGLLGVDNDDSEAQSLSALFSTSKPAKKEISKPQEIPVSEQQPFVALQPIESAVDAPSEKQLPKKSSAISSQFLTEASDLSRVNPMAELPRPFEIGPMPEVENNYLHTTASVEEIQKIVDQIVQKLYTVTTKGQTDMTVVLKQPPIFEGASVILTSYQAAKGEFNIRFENLTPIAKDLLDLQDSRNLLKTALEDKGFVVHIITTTTFQETTPVFEGEGLDREKREGHPEEKEPQDRKKHEE